MALIPTPRTDKNGRTVIRHMRPESEMPLPGRSIPPVAISSHPHVNVLDALFDGWRDGDTGEYYEEAMEIAEEQSPGTTQTLLGLLARENEHGDESVRDYITETFSAMDAHLDNGDRVEAAREFDGMNNGPFREQLIKAWAVGTVRGLYSGSSKGYDTLHDNDFIDGIEGTSFMLACDREEFADPDFWRGMTALYFLNLEFEDNAPEPLAFARYAGKHEDIVAVIRIADERGILDPTVIDAILTEKKGVKSALGEGVL